MTSYSDDVVGLGDDDNRAGDEDVDCSTLPKPQRTPKGRVQMDELTILRANGIKVQLEWDMLGQPTGEWAPKLQSYIGVLVRRHVKVRYECWEDMPADVKQTIWDAVESIFIIDTKWRSECLSSAAKKFRDWKSILHKKYIRRHSGSTDLLMIPPPNNNIDEADWHAFVLNRMSEAAKKKSAEGAEWRARNLYNHTMSRKGYAGLRKELVENLTGDEEVDRAILWKQGRADKKGGFAGEDLTHRVELIDRFIKDKEDGVLIRDNPSDDILTQALEKPDHPGRMRGVGGFVKPSTFMKVTRGQSGSVHQKLRSTNAELKETNARLTQMEAWVARLEEQMQKPESQKASCSAAKTEWENSRPVEVTSTPLPKAKARTSPPSKVTKTSNAHLPRELRYLVTWARKGLAAGEGFRVDIPESVFGYPTHTYVMKEEIDQVKQLQPVRVAFVVPYCWHLYKDVEMLDLLDRVRFADPSPLFHGMKEMKRVEAMTTMLLEMSANQLLLVPCNVGYHWILLVVDPYAELVLLLDPLPADEHVERWEHIMKKAIRIFCANKARRPKSQIDFVRIKCPIQDDEEKCAYYVMRYMKDIVENLGGDAPVQIKDLFCEAPYSSADIDEVREGWVAIIHEVVMLQNDDD